MNMRIFRYLEDHNLELEKTEREHYVFVWSHCWSNERIIYDVRGEPACQDCIHSNSFFQKMEELVKKIERRKLPLMEIRRPIE